MNEKHKISRADPFFASHYYISEFEQISTIQGNLAGLNDAISNQTIPIKCSKSRLCRTRDGYVLTYAGRFRPGPINICASAFANEDLLERILLHEMTHKYIGTEDYGYYYPPISALPQWDGQYVNPSQTEFITMSRQQYLNNADTYSYMMINEF